MRLSPAAFNAFLGSIGQSFEMRKASACPCFDQATGAPKPSCKRCHGFGWEWGSPVAGISGIASQKVQREWAQFGLWESGDVVLTVPSNSALYALAAVDRVLMLNTTEAFSFVRRRGVDDTRMFPVTQIDRVYWLNTLQQPVEGGIPTIGVGYALTWPTNSPTAGQQYSITGRKHPEYYVFQEMAQDRAHHFGADLPRRIVLRRFDLLSRSGLTHYNDAVGVAAGTSGVSGVSS